jgi:CRP/FNR family transcriptional regulator
MIAKTELSSFNYLLDDALIEEMSKVSTLRSFKKNDIIIDVGQELAFVPLLLSGNIKVMREDDDGHDLLLYVLESGDTCAMSLTCCMSKSTSKIRAVADSDAKLVMIPVEKMADWFNNNDSWRMFILQSYQVRFNEMLETIDTLAFLKMDERLYKYLTDQVKLGASETLNLTHQNIAEDLNTSRVVISRLLKQLEKEGRITLGRNKITVLEYV